MTQASARALGLKRYPSGVPCRQGHDGTRYTTSGECATCHTARNKSRRRCFKADGLTIDGAPRRTGWSPAMDATFREMWERGVQCEQIAAAVGRSLAAVRLRRAKIGLAPRSATFRPAAPEIAEVPPGARLSTVHMIVSPQKLERATALLQKRKQPFEVHLATKLPLRECYRIAAEIREAGRA